MATDQELNTVLNAVSADHPELDGTDDTDLTEEIADTATIGQLLDNFAAEVEDMFCDAIDLSLEGNPVRTHVELVSLHQEVGEMICRLRADLVAGVANRAEEIEEQGNQLRKQVIEES